jgi:phosphodiesterase/alkaline phosphatase D-like protein
VRRSPQKLMIYWRSNTEPDLARYYVYRGSTPDFAVAGQAPLAVIEPEREHFLQMYIDSGLKPGTRYFYKVLAEDFAGNRQSRSSTTSATTPK